jgi:hypothetical protein
MWYHWILAAIVVYVAYRCVMALVYGPKTLVNIGSSLAVLFVNYYVGTWTYNAIYPPSLIPGFPIGGRRR